MNRFFFVAQRPYRSFVVTLMVAALWIGGCSTTPSADDEPSEQTGEQKERPPRPGAAAWQKHALRMPAEAPVVLWARPGRLVDSLGSLRRWLFDQPEMFGSGGEQMIGQLRAQWKLFTESAGADPFSSKTLDRLGLDSTREVYVGAYPVDRGDNRRYVEKTFSTTRSALELEDDESLIEALDELTFFGGMGVPEEFREELEQHIEVPEGAYRDAERAVGDASPFSGARAVIPLRNSSTFIDGIEEAFAGGNYDMLDLEEPPARAVYDDGDDEPSNHFFYYDKRGDLPLVMVRIEDEMALVDLMIGLPDGVDVESDDLEAGDREAFQAVADRVTDFETGRPAAPRPATEPMVGVAADQSGVANLARLRGYQTAFDKAESAGVDERDKVFLQNVHQTEQSAGNWSAADGDLSGVSYALYDGQDEDHLVRLGISLYGEPGDEALSVSRSRRDLGVDERGIGLSLDTAPTTDESWQEWVGLSDPDDLFGYFTAAFFDPALFALSVPRNAVLLVANANDLFKKRLPDEMAAVLDNSEIIERLEFASAGVDMRHLRQKPRYVGLATLDEEASDEQIRELSASVRRAIERRIEGDDEDDGDGSRIAEDASLEETDEDVGPEDGDKAPDDASEDDEVSDEDDQKSAQEEPEAFPFGELVEFERDDGGPPIFVFVERDDEQPYMFISYGLERDDSKEEFERIGEPAKEGPASKTAFARIEPIALLSLAKMLSEDALGNLDINVIAQRFGGLVFSVEPRIEDGVQTIEYDFELRRPPELE